MRKQWVLREAQEAEVERLSRALDINDFAFALLVGFISGVYSTIYIASPLLLIWEGRSKR